MDTLHKNISALLTYKEIADNYNRLQESHRYAEKDRYERAKKNAEEAVKALMGGAPIQVDSNIDLAKAVSEIVEAQWGDITNSTLARVDEKLKQFQTNCEKQMAELTARMHKICGSIEKVEISIDTKITSALDDITKPADKPAPKKPVSTNKTARKDLI